MMQSQLMVDGASQLRKRSLSGPCERFLWLETHERRSRDKDGRSSASSHARR